MGWSRQNVTNRRRGREHSGRESIPGFKKPGRQRPWWWGLVAMLAAGLLYVAKEQGWLKDSAPTRADRDNPPARVDPTPPGRETSPPAEPAAGRDDLSALIRARRSDVLVESAGRVVKVLPDDNDGSRHQRFLVRSGTETILIAHNIDLAPRVPLKQGDDVRFKGELEWNERGGVIHWTHHDPGRRRPGGWIELRGNRYE